MASPLYRERNYSTANAAWLIAGLIAYSAYGEVIYLKSGGAIRGIITQTEGTSITIDVGFGVTSLDTTDIDSIAHSSKEERMQLQQRRTSRYSDNYQSLPLPLQSLVESIRRLRTMRFRAISRQEELERLDNEIDSLENVLSSGAREYDALEKELNAISMQSQSERFRLIGKAHHYNASIISSQNSIQKKQINQQTGNPFLLEYIDSLDRFVERFKAFKTSFAASSMHDYRSVVSEIENDLWECKAEFKTVVPDVTHIQGNHIVVPAIVNNRGPVLLLLDTGASSVMLSRAAASRLGIDYENGNKVMATLANGETVTGYSILLRSVAVSGFRTDNVRAVVLDKPPGPGIDGLLGMSYLQRFVLHIDPINKKLVLKKIVTR